MPPNSIRGSLTNRLMMFPPLYWQAHLTGICRFGHLLNSESTQMPTLSHQDSNSDQTISPHREMGCSAEVFYRFHRHSSPISRNYLRTFSYHLQTNQSLLGTKGKLSSSRQDFIFPTCFRSYSSVASYHFHPHS